MGVNATNRIVSPKHAIYEQVRQYEAEKYKKEKYNKRAGFKKYLVSTIECSQCHRKMKASIGLAQIENKRENAPICIPCIMGIPRKPLEKIIEEREADMKKYSPKAREELKKCMNRYKRIY